MSTHHHSPKSHTPPHHHHGKHPHLKHAPLKHHAKTFAFFALLAAIFIAGLGSARADSRTAALFSGIQDAATWIDTLQEAGTWNKLRLSFNDGKKWNWSPDGKWATRLIWKDGQAIIRVWNAEEKKIMAELTGDDELAIWLDERRSASGDVDWRVDARWTTWTGKTALLWALWNNWE